MYAWRRWRRIQFPLQKLIWRARESPLTLSGQISGRRFHGKPGPNWQFISEEMPFNWPIANMLTPSRLSFCADNFLLLAVNPASPCDWCIRRVLARTLACGAPSRSRTCLWKSPRAWDETDLGGSSRPLPQGTLPISCLLLHFFTFLLSPCLVP